MNVISLLGKLSLFLYPLKIQTKLNNLLDKINSVRLLNNINGGENSRVCRSVSLYNSKFMTFGKNVYIQKGSVIATHLSNNYSPQLSIGNNCSIGEYNHITCVNKISIGDNLLTGRRVTITDNSHGTLKIDELKIAPNKRCLYSKGPVIIGNNVWIGENVIILPNVSIGDNCIIGAGSVVTKNIPPCSVAVGNPAYVIKSIK